jgi:excisionase family DNA binding protein
MGIEPLNVSIPEAARIIGCGRSKLYEIISTNELPVIKLGRRSLVPVAALRAFVEAKMTEAA